MVMQNFINFESIIQRRWILGKVAKVGGQRLNGFQVIQLFMGGTQKHPPPPPPLTPRSESGVKIKKKQSRLTLSSKETKSLEIPSFDKMRTYYS